jgi:hypothetical protein
MSDPTPEERARTAMDGMFDLGTIQFSIADQIRVAVEAEREACIVIAVDHEEAPCGPCECGAEIAAAIRARGESDADV